MLPNVSQSLEPLLWLIHGYTATSSWEAPAVPFPRLITFSWLFIVWYDTFLILFSQTDEYVKKCQRTQTSSHARKARVCHCWWKSMTQTFFKRPRSRPVKGTFVQHNMYFSVTLRVFVVIVLPLYSLNIGEVFFVKFHRFAVKVLCHIQRKVAFSFKLSSIQRLSLSLTRK